MNINVFYFKHYRIIFQVQLMLRWRRGCATDGHELTNESEADPGTLTGELGRMI